METIKIVDHKGKTHFIQNVVFWSYVSKSFRIRMTIDTVIHLDMPYDDMGMRTMTKLISIDIGYIERLTVI